LRFVCLKIGTILILGYFPPPPPPPQITYVPQADNDSAFRIQGLTLPQLIAMVYKN
jgi:hypothetical protein